jgi:hypothetical protein
MMEVEPNADLAGLHELRPPFAHAGGTHDVFWVGTVFEKLIPDVSSTDGTGRPGTATPS